MDERTWLQHYWPNSQYVQVSSGSSSSDSGDELVQWMVDADYGELDPKVVAREEDTGNKKGGEKESGWTNPLGWTDGGNDDDVVVLQIKEQGFLRGLRVPSERNFLQYKDSEGPTKVDYGEEDNAVSWREENTGNKKGGEKESGWTNPLGWTDGGDADESVL